MLMTDCFYVRLHASLWVDRLTVRVIWFASMKNLTPICNIFDIQHPEALFTGCADCSAKDRGPK